MNDLLIMSLIVVILYYFIFYLPNNSQKHSLTNEDLEIEKNLDQLIKEINHLNNNI